MRTKRSMTMVFVVVLTIISLQACNSFGLAITPSPLPLPTFTSQPPTETRVPTYTLTPTIEPTMTLTLEPTATLPDVIPYAELITPNEIAKGATGATIDLWYFIGQQGQVVEIFVSGQGNNITFSLRDETNEGLLSCGSPTGSGCSIKEYMLPYTGLYYIRIDPLLKFNYLNYTVCKNDSLPAFCYQIDSYSLILNFK